MARASAASRQNHLHPAAPVMTYLPVWLSVSPAIGHPSPWPSSSVAHQFNPAPAPAVSTLRCGMIPPYHLRGFGFARLASGHGSNAGHSLGVAGVDARRATPPDPRLARWGLARCCQLDPSHPALGTREDPGVEPCLIPCGPSWPLRRLPAWPVLRSPLLERPGIASALHA